MSERTLIRLRESLAIGRLIGYRTYNDVIRRATILMRHDLQRVCRAKGIDWRAALEADMKREHAATGMPVIPDKSPMIDD